MSRLADALEQIDFARRYTRERIESVPLVQWFTIPPGGVTNLAWQVGHLAMAEYRLCLERLRPRTALTRNLSRTRCCWPSVAIPFPHRRDSGFHAEEILTVFDRVHARVLAELPGYPDADLDLPPLKPHKYFQTRIAGSALRSVARDDSLRANRHYSPHARTETYLVTRPGKVNDARRRLHSRQCRRVKANCRNRGVSDVPTSIASSRSRPSGRELVQKRSETAAKKNAISSQFAKATTPRQRQALKEQSTALDKEIGVIDDELKLVEGDLLANLILIPNMTHPDAPVGLRRRPRTRSSRIRRAAEVRLQAEGPRRARRGARPGRLRGRRAGRRAEVLLPQERGGAAGTGPRAVRDADAGRRGLHADHHARPGPRRGARRASASCRAADPETQIYAIADTDLSLIATAEITLGGMHRDQILDEADAADASTSACRTASAPRPAPPGRDTRGLYRVHQFTKVEMFAFCTPEQSDAIHEEILRASRRRSSRGWACRTTSSTPAPATWAARPIASTTSKPGCPAAATGGEYGEVTSTSNCTDYQARRLDIRYKSAGPEGDAVRPHAQRHRRRLTPGAGRHPGELPAGRRPRGRSRGAAAVGGQGPDCGQIQLTGTSPASFLFAAAAHPWWGNEPMRTMPFWVGGFLLIAFCAVQFPLLAHRSRPR